MDDLSHRSKGGIFVGRERDKFVDPEVSFYIERLETENAKLRAALRAWRDDDDGQACEIHPGAGYCIAHRTSHCGREEARRLTREAGVE